MRRRFARGGKAAGRSGVVLVAEALRDLERGRRVSIPSRRYKALAVLMRYTPTSVQARFQGLGRK